MPKLPLRLLRRLPALLLGLLLTLPAGANDGTEPRGEREMADSVLVIKSQRRLFLLRDGKPWKVYRVALGPKPWGPKQQAGDERTPEGHYLLDYKLRDSRFHKAIHISYPNAEDRERARKLGVDPGGQIMIHGQPNGSELPPWEAQQFNWTDGCIAVTNAEMDEIWSLVEVGTPIEIRP
jgi:murein L,D-transpeptidase YafK